MLFCSPVKVYSQSCTTMSEVFGWPGGGGRELVAGGEVMPASLPVLCLQLQDEDIKDYFEKCIKTTVTGHWACDLMLGFEESLHLEVRCTGTKYCSLYLDWTAPRAIPAKLYFLCVRGVVSTLLVLFCS